MSGGGRGSPAGPAQPWAGSLEPRGRGGTASARGAGGAAEAGFGPAGSGPGSGPPVAARGWEPDGVGPRNRGGGAESRPPVWGRRCVDRVLRGCEARGVKRVSLARAMDAPDRRRLRGKQGFGDRFMDGFFVCQHFTGTY